MIDRTTKAVLVAIAIALWLQLAGTWFPAAPLAAQADRTARLVPLLEGIDRRLETLGRTAAALERDVAAIARRETR